MIGKKLRFRSIALLYSSAEEAVADIHNNATIASGGFGYRGVPDTLIAATAQRPIQNLALIACDPFGLEAILTQRKATSVTMSYVLHPLLQQQLLSGYVTLHLVPMGTLVEKLRCGGCGIPAFYTRTGVHTWVESGLLPRRWSQGRVIENSQEKETREFNGGKFILEASLRPDFGLVRAWKGDRIGNLVYRNAARNFNPLVAKAAKVTVAEVEELVETGSLRPEEIHTPSAYVHKLVVRDPSRPEVAEQGHKSSSISKEKLTIARRAAREVQPGLTVNLGIGLPTLITSFFDSSQANIHSENGILRMGPAPLSPHFDLVNAGRQPVSLHPGSSLFDSAESFAMIRGGHIDLSILGAFQVSKRGDIANWIVPGKRFPGIGGAMDLAASGSRLIAVMTHCEADGTAKLVEECSLPVTGRAAVDTVISEKGVFRMKTGGKPVLQETAGGVSVEDVRRCTGFAFDVSPSFRPSAY